MVFISDFQIIRPKNEIPQIDLINWLAKAHATAEAGKQKDWKDSQLEEFHGKIHQKLLSLGLGEGKIERRGFSLDDPLHQKWDDMEIYNLLDHPNGKSMESRMDVFDRVSKDVVERFYLGKDLPRHIIQVTCTGYISPSAIQHIISQKNAKSYPTHAFHMGCYGALAAIRIAEGLVGDTSVDIIHTEMCGLHMNPSNHGIDQLVAQTLFADGFIRYRVSNKQELGFRLLAVHEEIIPETLSSMNWRIGNFGMQIFLAKEMPIHIKRHLQGFVQRLLGSDEDVSSYIFAIHPGGPKIIEGIEKFLSLDLSQTAHTRSVLKKYGNMSSATLPTIWHEILQDPKVEAGKKVISLAFGPGLTIFGAVLEKQEV